VLASIVLCMDGGVLEADKALRKALAAVQRWTHAGTSADDVDAAWHRSCAAARAGDAQALWLARLELLRRYRVSHGRVATLAHQAVVSASTHWHGCQRSQWSPAPMETFESAVRGWLAESDPRVAPGWHGPDPAFVCAVTTILVRVCACVSAAAAVAAAAAAAAAAVVVVAAAAAAVVVAAAAAAAAAAALGVSCCCASTPRWCVLCPVQSSTARTEADARTAVDSVLRSMAGADGGTWRCSTLGVAGAPSLLHLPVVQPALVPQVLLLRSFAASLDKGPSVVAQGRWQCACLHGCSLAVPCCVSAR
jgi:hypothetical protein